MNIGESQGNTSVEALHNFEEHHGTRMGRGTNTVKGADLNCGTQERMQPRHVKEDLFPAPAFA